MARWKSIINKANASFEQSDEVYKLQQEVDQLKEAIALQGVGGTQQLMDKLNSAEKELELCRKEKECLKQSVEELDKQKETLLEEITHLRIDHEKDTNTAATLSEAMEHMQKDFDTQIKKYEADFMVQEETIQQHEETFAELHANIDDLEGQKTLLLDEITFLRLEFDRETKAKASMEARVDELSHEAGECKLASMEERATAAEENSSKLLDTINDLQEELQKVTSSYKADVAHLEEKETRTAAALREEMEQMQKEYDTQIEKYDADFKAQEEMIQQHKESFVELHNNIVELEEQKALLLGEMASTEERATAAEENSSKLQDTINDLQEELQKVTSSYKADVARLEEKDTKTATALREEMEQMQKEYDTQIEKYEADFRVQEEMIQQHEESFAELHNNTVELEEQKALLLGEITGFEERASAAEENSSKLLDTINDLQEELRKVTISYKADVARLEEKDTKTAAALREEMEQMQKDFDTQIEKYEADFKVQEEVIQQHKESFGQLHDNIDDLEEQKALLLGEITGLRQERATAAEENSSKLQDTINHLQEELRKVTSSHKADMARLEERIAARDAQLDQQKLEVTKKATELTEAEEHNSSVNEELKELRTKMETYERETSKKEHEIATMVSQHILCKKRATQNIMEHAAKVDDLRAQVEELQGEVGSLKRKLREEQLAAAKFMMDNNNFRSPLQAPAMPPNAKSIPKRFHFSTLPPPRPPPSTLPQAQNRLRPCVTGTPPSLTKARLQPASPRTLRTSVSAGGTHKSQPWP